jgi:hypothetical protein
MSFLPFAFYIMEGAAELPELVLVSLIPLIIAVPIFLYGMKVQKEGGSARLKWIALIPLALAAVWGLRYVLFVTNPTNVAILEGFGQMSERGKIAHYAAFILPIVAIIALIVWAIMDKRSKDPY